MFRFTRKAPSAPPAPTVVEPSPPAERRRQERKEHYFECLWASDWSEERSRVSSLSPKGCYIESRSDVPAEGTALSAITITLPSGDITVQGKVVHSIRGVGFGVEFTGVNEDAHARLTAFASA